MLNNDSSKDIEHLGTALITQTPLIEIVSLQGHIQTIYMAVYADKLLLLDGGGRPDVSLILSYIKNTLKRPLTQLKVVMVSHMHADHAGGAQALKKATGCHIVSANKETQWYGGLSGRTMHLVDMGLAYFVANRQGKPLKSFWYSAHLIPDMTVKEGDAIPNFADWQVMETSGHTDRDLSFYHIETKQIYTGDLIIKLSHKFVPPVPVYYPDRYRDSLRRVRDLAPKRVMLAHGGIKYIETAVFDDLIERAPKKPLTVKGTIEKKLFGWRQSR